MYRLHCVGASGNSYKVALYLNCAGLDWESVGVDFAGGETQRRDWREGTNDMGEVPVLEAGGRRLSQSGAILLWLADTVGRFSPDGADERLEGLRWILFDNHKFTGNYAAYRMQYSLVPQAPHPSVLSFLKARVEGAFSIVDRHLSDRTFMLGSRPTIVDFSIAGYLFYPAEETGFDLQTTYPAIQAWRERIAALPGWRPPYDLMPVGTSLNAMRRPSISS